MCFDYEVNEDKLHLFFSFHYNRNMGIANMLIYGEDGLLEQSGNDTNYKSFIELHYQHGGIYLFCFERLSDSPLEIYFDVSEEQEDHYHAGKEDINKLSQRINEFLVDIKKVGWEYK